MTTPKQAFTPRETELLTIAFQCLKQKPDIDYPLMALKANLQNAKSARDRFGALYNKIVAGKFGGDDAASPSPAKGKGTPLKHKTGLVGDDDDGDEDGEDEITTPAAKKKKVTPSSRKGKGKKEEKVSADDDEDGKVEEDVVKAVVLNEDDGDAGEEV